MATRLQKRRLSEMEDGNELSNFVNNETTIAQLVARGITKLFPIQKACYEFVKKGDDLIGKDRTGSGKTLTYSLPLTEQFREQKYFQNKRGQKPILLVVLPTRELAIQVNNEYKALNHDGEYRNLAVYGGTEIREQCHALRQGVEILVATPGRLLDLLSRGVFFLKKAVCLSELKAIVLDEADEMLNMGFQEDVEKIYQHILDANKNHVQKLLFSATYPEWVKNIERKFISSSRQKIQTRHFIDMFQRSENQTSLNVQHLAVSCNYFDRVNSIGDIILCYAGEQGNRSIIFAESKKECNEIMLNSNINFECQVLHGDIPQKQREITFQAFRDKKLQCLIATNVAARGLDIPHVDLIVQLEPPKSVEDYIHRAGRTARAGRSGTCVTFYSPKQQGLLERIEKKAHIKMKKIGTPQPEQIIEAHVQQSLFKLSRVPDNILEHFKSRLKNKDNVDDLLARAVAFMSGYKDSANLKQRSLLFSQENMVSYIIKPGFQIKFSGYVWNFLKNNFRPEIAAGVKFVKLIKGRDSAAFDIHQDFVNDLEFTMAELDTSVILEKATQVVEFDEGSMPTQQTSDTKYGRGGSDNQRRDNGRSHTENRDQRHGGDNRTKERHNRNKEFEICMYNLPLFYEEDQVKEVLRKNNISINNRVRVLKDNYTQKSRGISFFECSDKVQFLRQDAFERCLKLDKLAVEGRNLRVKLATQN